MNNFKQKTNIKFLVKLRIITTQTFNLLREANGKEGKDSNSAIAK